MATRRSTKAIVADAKRVEAENKLALARASKRVLAAAIAEMKKDAPTRGRGPKGGSGAVEYDTWGLSGSYAAGRPNSSRPIGAGPGAGGIPAPIGSADAHADEIRLITQRGYCQDLRRNSDLARTLAERCADFSVGDGSSPIFESSDEAFNAEARDWWKRWWEGGAFDCRGMHSGPQFERLVEIQYEGDGDVGLLLRGDGTVQVIDADRVVSKSGRGNSAALDDWSSGNGTEVSGVILDKSGRPTGFRVADYLKGGIGVDLNPQRVLPASGVLWLVNPLGKAGGVNQTRGEPMLGPVLPRIVELNRYIHATHMAARIAACLSLLIKSTRPADLQSAMNGATTAGSNSQGEARDERSLELGPGSVLYLKNDEQAETVNPNQPSGQFDPFVTASLRMIGNRVGLPMVMWAGDPRGLNLATFKGQVTAAGVSIRTRQSYRTRRMMTPLLEWGLARAVRSGEIKTRPPADWNKHRWIVEPLPVVDPEAEVRTAALGCEKGFDDYDSANLRLWGRRASDVFEKLAAQQKEIKSLDLTLLTTPGQQVADASAAGAGPSTPPDPANPDGN